MLSCMLTSASLLSYHLFIQRLHLKRNNCILLFQNRTFFIEVIVRHTYLLNAYDQKSDLVSI